MLRRFLVLSLGTVLLAACQTGAIDEPANPGEPPPPPATPPAPSPTVQPLAPTGATTDATTGSVEVVRVITAGPAPELGPDAPPGTTPTLATIGEPALLSGIFRGTAPNGQSVQVEIRDVDATGARVNHLLSPGGPLLPGQGVWRNGTLTMVMAEGTFSYTPDGPNALRYQGPGPSGGTVTVALTRV